MRMLFKLIVVILIAGVGYLAYQFFVKNKKPEDVIREKAGGIQQAAEEAHVAKGNLLYAGAKFEEALQEFSLALKDPTTSAEDRKQALRRVGDCNYKIWEWNKSKTENARQALAAYEAFCKQYPDSATMVAKAMEELKALR